MVQIVDVKIQDSCLLGRFSAEEAPVIAQAIDQAADAVECIIQEGFNKAMNKFNKG